MSMGITGTQQKELSPANKFRQLTTVLAGAVLREWVGEERCAEAIGRVRTAITAAADAAKDPRDFYACTPQSVANVVATAALTGIMPSTGASALAYVLPRRPRADEAPQLQYCLSHRGLNALARRCGQTMIAIPVSRTDKISVDSNGIVTITERDIDNPAMRLEDLRGVMVVVKELATGVVTTSEFMPTKLIEPRRAMSMSWSSERFRKYSPWYNWPVEMAMKTAMHYAISRGWCVIDDTEATRALSIDGAADIIDVAPIEPQKLEDLMTPPENGNVSEAVGEPEAQTAPAHQHAISPDKLMDEIASARMSRRLTQLAADVKAAFASGAIAPEDRDLLEGAIAARLTEISPKGGA